MDTPNQPAMDWQTELRRKSTEELLRLLDNPVGDDKEKNYPDEIRKVLQERKIASARVVSSVLTLILNFLVLGPALWYLVATVTDKLWPVGGGPGEGIGSILALMGNLAVAGFILGGIDGAVLYATRKSPGFKPYRAGFIASLGIWAVILGFSLLILGVFFLITS